MRIEMSGELCDVARALHPQSLAAGRTLLATFFFVHHNDLRGWRWSQQKLEVERQGVVEYEREAGAGLAGLVDGPVVSHGQQEGLAGVDVTRHFPECFLSEGLEQLLALLIRQLDSDRLVLGRVGDHHQVGDYLQGLGVGNTEQVTGGLGVESHDQDHKLPGDHSHPPLTLPVSLLRGEEDLHNIRLAACALGAFRAVHLGNQTARESKQN